MAKGDARIVSSVLNKNLTKLQQAAFDRLAAKEEDYDKKIEELDLTKALLEEKTRELAEIRVKRETELIEAALHQEALKKQLESYQGLLDKLDALKKKMASSYTMEDISSYLNGLIQSFNENTQSAQDYARYIINNMDVDLKVRIYGDEKEKLRFTAPSITETTEESLSSIKISIQAIPN